MAAGPVFEGAELECGGSAVDGAIVSVYNVGRSMFYSTVNNKKARSIAGSGVIDAIACFLRSDMIELDGYVEENLFIGDSDVYITPNDIRNIQMAKSAIYTSISLCCPSLENVDRFFIAGGFGSRLNIDNAIQIGMLPKEMKGKIKWCSNASADGARLILLDGSMQVKAGEIAKKCKTIYLNEDEKFKEMYIKNMNF